MTRLVATIGLDVRLQARNGFYYAVLVVLAAWLAVLTRIDGVDWRPVLPAIVFGNLVMVSFYFVAGMVLLEKVEGTLEAQVVTPLADWEYLGSKVVTLTGLSLLEQAVVVGAAVGSEFGPLALSAGIVLAAALYTLVGFMAVARYDSINEYLFPSAVYVVAVSLPLLDYFGIWESWVMYLHPFQAPLVLLGAAFRPVAVWQVVYGILYALVWITVLVQLDRRAFARFVVAREHRR